MNFSFNCVKSSFFWEYLPINSMSFGLMERVEWYKDYTNN